MTDKPKPVKLSFSIKLILEKASYESESIMSVTFEEQVPANVDQILYAKKRIKEELDRQKIVIASHAPKAKPQEEADPLEESPF